MYNEFYDCKSLVICIDKIREKPSFGNMECGLISLRESPEDMQRYVDVLFEIHKKALQCNIAKGLDRTAVQAVNNGRPIDDVSLDVTYGQLRHALVYIKEDDVHKKWSDVFPELKMVGRLA